MSFQYSTYLLCVKFTQSLNRQQLFGGFPAVVQRWNLQTALLKSLNSIIKVFHGLGLVLPKEGIIFSVVDSSSHGLTCIDVLIKSSRLSPWSDPLSDTCLWTLGCTSGQALYSDALAVPQCHVPPCGTGHMHRMWMSFTDLKAGCEFLCVVICPQCLTLWYSSMCFRWFSSQMSRFRYSFQSAWTASMWAWKMAKDSMFIGTTNIDRAHTHTQFFFFSKGCRLCHSCYCLCKSTT